MRRSISADGAIAQRAADADVEVVAMRMTVRRLRHHLRGAVQHDLGAPAARSVPEQPAAQRVRHERAGRARRDR
jgi:signal transduction histidine kinase